MKCPKCGHANPDIRLFCMNCGELLPDETGELQNQERQPEEKADAFARPAQSAASFTEPETAAEKETGAAEDLFDIEDETPVGRPAVAPARPVLDRRVPVETGRANTYVPRRSETMEPEDFFAVRGQVLPEYDDEHEMRPKKRRPGNEFEDDAPQSFAVRHMRGIVTLALLAVTAVIMLIWVNTDSAQLAMAKIDMAWKAEPYAELGAEAYAQGDLSGAGYYYMQALKREADNKDYAVMAANAYIEGGYTAKALEAIRECIGIAPEDADLYAALIDLQGGYENMPASDRQLVDKGYELTGDERLKNK